MKKLNFKKIFSATVVSTVAFAMITTNVGAATMAEIQDALANQDFELADSLIFEEATVDESLNFDTNLVVDEDDALWDFNRNILGVQCEISTHGFDFFERYTNQLSDGYLAIADELADFPVARWGGTSTNSVSLIGNIGPLEERKQSIRWTDDVLVNEAFDMGPVEFIKAVQAINPNASFLFCLPIYVDTPEETTNFTSFLLDDKDKSKWGALRAACGIEKPVNLLGYELGNENYFSAQPQVSEDDENYQTYINSKEYATFKANAVKTYTDTCKLHINAIKAKYPNVKFYPNVNGKSERVYWRDWNGGVAENLNGYIDGVAFHNYYSTPASVENVCDKEINKIQDLFVEKTGKKTTIAHTEHAIWSSNEQVKRQSHQAALAESNFINHMGNRNDIVCANYHNIISGSSYTSPGHWAMFTRKGNKFYDTGVNRVYKLYQNNIGKTVVKSTLSNNGNGYVSALATKNDDGSLVVALVNGYNDRRVNIKLNFNDSYELVKETTFTAPSIASVAYGDSTVDLFTTKSKYLNIPNCTSYTLNNKCVVMLTFKKTQGEYEYKYTKVYRDDFDKYGNSEAEYTIAKGQNADVKIAGDWYVTTFGKAEKYNTPSKFSIKDGTGIKMTATAVTYTDSYLPMLVYKGNYSKLTNHYRISANLLKNSVTSGCGIRFMVHNNGANYYSLWLGGTKEDKTRWLFSKVKDNAVVDSIEGEQYTTYNTNGNGALHENNRITIEYDNGLINCTINGKEYNLIDYNKKITYNDKSPFGVDAKKTQIAFGDNSSAVRDNNYSVVDQFEIGNLEFVKSDQPETNDDVREYPKLQKDENSTDEFVANGEPDNVIYIQKVRKQDGNLYYLENNTRVRKVVNNGNTTVKVYVSTDDFSYKQLAEIPAKDTFINTLTAKGYNYVKVEGGKDISIYSDLCDNDVLTGLEYVCDIDGKVNGSSENISFTSSNRNVAYIEDNKLAPLRNGTTVITVTNGTNSVSRTIKVNVLDTIYEDFGNYEKSDLFYAPEGCAVRRINIAGDWWLYQGSSGVLKNKPKIEFDGKKMVYWCSAGDVNVFYSYIPFLMYEGDYSGINQKYTIETNYSLSSVMAGFAIKFHIHNNMSSYYMLYIVESTRTGKTWHFYKVTNGITEEIYSGDDVTANNADKSGPIQGNGKVAITYDNGTVSFTIDGKIYNNRAYKVSKTFVDSKPFDVAPKDTKVAILSRGTKTTYSVGFTDFTIKGEGNKDIITSPINSDDTLIDLSNKKSENPVVIMKSDDGKYKMLSDKTGDGFFKITKDNKNDFGKMYLWDFDDLRPLGAIIENNN